MGIFGREAAPPLAADLTGALRASREPRQDVAAKRLAENQERIRRVVGGERVDAVCPSLGGGALAVTDHQSVVVGPDGAVGRFPHSSMERAKAMSNSHEGLVVLTPRPGAGPETRIRVTSSDVAGAMRDAVQERVSQLQWPPPQLFPDFYFSVLDDLGKPDSEQNVLALVEYVSQMFSVQAIMWLTGDGGDPDREWFGRFDVSRVPPERRPYLVDDMLRFFWERDWRYRRPVAEYPDSARATILEPGSHVRRYPGELPFGMWSDE